MRFTKLNAAVTDLRNSLHTFVGSDALRPITLRPPAGDDDEASFLRLVGWSYVLFFEVGRISIPFLIGISAKMEDDNISRRARTLVHALRTWTSHNLGLDDVRDVEMSKVAQRWFLDTCGRNPPRSKENWAKCCQGLCDEVAAVVSHCQDAVTLVLDAPDDGQSTIEDLRRRLERSWPAHQFDSLVADAATRLGVAIDPVRFREPRLKRWRDFVESLADSDDPSASVGRLIERDLLDHTAFILPIDGRDIMDVFGIGPGPEVARILRRARGLYQSGVSDKLEILRRLAENAEGGDAS
ncbi:hypothetical protein [Mesorhizobium hawassense]|uniref:hypothetical protein n=1 Tax=Mesorhizobium hawassense TaxID=1209954 RepID=UPI0011BDE4D8|nr:hypothetical protein [Mesorhizobium hawassense]